MLNHRGEDLTQNAPNAYLTIAEKTKIGSARDINVTIAETNKPTVFLTPK